MISVVIPSRLARMPDGRLWLERALQSVRNQTSVQGHGLEVILGLDSGASPPDCLLVQHPGLKSANASGSPGQAAALNAALDIVTGDHVAFLEDDDWWVPLHLRQSVEALGEFEFVSSSQRVVDPLGSHIGVLGFATPSGWVLPRALLDKVGAFEGSFRLHLDNDWLGRLNRIVRRRGHFIENTKGDSKAFMAKRPDLGSLLEQAKPAAVSLLETPGPYTQVVRTQNPEGGLERSRTDPVLKERSRVELAAIEAKYGCVPW
jgi:glycosyltransferase involved in cell wall biosynthesis